MSVNFSGSAQVRFSAYFFMDNQIAIVDRLVSALNVVPGTLWNSATCMTQMVTDGLDVAMKLCVSDDAQLVGWKMYAKDVGSPPLIDRNTAVAGACTGGTGHLPTQNAGLLGFLSSIGGSQGRGRMYVPFPFTSAVTATGLLSAGYQTKLRDLGNAFTPGFIVPNVGVGGGTLTVRPCTKFTVGTTPPLAFAMTGITIGDGFATQKRRGFFGKPNNNPF